MTAVLVQHLTFPRVSNCVNTREYAPILTR